MTQSDLLLRERTIVEAFRRAAQERTNTEIEARRALVDECSAADVSLEEERDRAERDHRAAEEAAATLHTASLQAADVALDAVQRRAASRLEAILALCDGAHTALGLADFRHLEDRARLRAINPQPGDDPDHEQSRCLTEASKAAKRVDHGCQQKLDRRHGRRNLLPQLRTGLLIGALLLGLGVVVQQGLQPCGWLQTIQGGHQHCGSAAPHRGAQLPPPDALGTGFFAYQHERHAAGPQAASVPIGAVPRRQADGSSEPGAESDAVLA